MRTKLGMVVGAIVAVGALASVPAASRAAIMVDDFMAKNTGVWPISTTASNPSGGFGNTETGLVGVLGGFRGALVMSTAMDVPGYDTFQEDLFNGSGFSFLDVSSSAGAKGALQLNYGTPYGPHFGLGPTADTQAVRVTFLAVDLAGGGPLRLDVLAYQGNSAPILAPVFVTSPGAQSVDVPLTFFWNTFGATTLDGLQLTFAGDKGADYRIDSISLVPEPGMAAGLMIAAGAMALRRKRA